MDALLRHSGNRLPMDIVIPFGGKAISFATIGYSSFLAGLGSEGYKTHLLAIGQPDYLVGNDDHSEGRVVGGTAGGWLGRSKGGRGGNKRAENCSVGHPNQRPPMAKVPPQ